MFPLFISLPHFSLSLVTQSPSTSTRSETSSEGTSHSTDQVTSNSTDYSTEVSSQVLTTRTAAGKKYVTGPQGMVLPVHGHGRVGLLFCACANCNLSGNVGVCQAP